MKKIKDIKTLTNVLNLQKDSRFLRDAFLKERRIETKIDDNLRHVTYLSNSLLIEHQQQMYRLIKHHTKQKNGWNQVHRDTD